MNRRNLLIGGLTTLFCAPAIVRVASLMPVKSILEPVDAFPYEEYGLGYAVLKSEGGSIPFDIRVPPSTSMSGYVTREDGSLFYF